MKRRQVISTLAVGLSAGCLSQASRKPAAAEYDCQVAKSSLSAKPVSPTQQQQKYLIPIEFAEQSPQVKDVFQAVIDGETIRTCPTKTITSHPEQALAETLQVVQDTVQRQAQKFGGDPPDWVEHTAYLQQEQAFYALAAHLSDIGISSPAPLPESTETTALLTEE